MTPPAKERVEEIREEVRNGMAWGHERALLAVIDALIEELKFYRPRPSKTMSERDALREELANAKKEWSEWMASSLRNGIQNEQDAVTIKAQAEMLKLAREALNAVVFYLTDECCSDVSTANEKAQLALARLNELDAP